MLTFVFLFYLFSFQDNQFIPVTLRGKKLGVVCWLYYSNFILIDLEYIRHLLVLHYPFHFLRWHFPHLSPFLQSGFLILVLGMMFLDVEDSERPDVQQLVCTPHARTVLILGFGDLKSYLSYFKDCMSNCSAVHWLLFVLLFLI